MKSLQPITEDAMITAFLGAECGTKRHGDQYRAALKHLSESDKMPEGFLTRPKYAELRRDVLAYVRGWPDKSLFNDFPRCTWEQGVLEYKDLALLDYVPYSYWDELSRGSHHVVNGAAAVAQGAIIYVQSNSVFWEIEKLTRQDQVFPPLIVLRIDQTERLTLVEGYARATGFALADQVPQAQPIIVGTPLEKTQWGKEKKS